MSKTIVLRSPATLYTMASALLFATAACGAADTQGDSPPSAVPEAAEAEEPVGQTKQALRAPRFLGQCTSRQKKDLGIFHEWLYGWVSDANYVFYMGQAEAGVYQFFRPVTADQRATVWYRLEGMQYSLEVDEYTYNCAAPDKYECAVEGNHAFVFEPHINHRINLCPKWWEEDNHGRLFVLVHELSHALGSEDVPKPAGYDGTALDLAVLLPSVSPDRAVKNANNYAFFVMHPQGWY